MSQLLRGFDGNKQWTGDGRIYDDKDCFVIFFTSFMSTSPFFSNQSSRINAFMESNRISKRPGFLITAHTTGKLDIAAHTTGQILENLRSQISVSLIIKNSFVFIFILMFLALSVTLVRRHRVWMISMICRHPKRSNDLPSSDEIETENYCVENAELRCFCDSFYNSSDLHSSQ